jgi:nucleotide-binding universal stress UspA family protein
MYLRILVAIDGTGTAERGLDEAIALAQRLGSTLRILHVADARMLGAAACVYAPPEQLVDDWRIAGERLVPAAVERARARGVEAQGTVRCDPSRHVHELILEEARAANAELIVMGTHGRGGLPRLLQGSDAESVLRESPIPVLLVRGTAGPEQAVDVTRPISTARS